MLFDHSGVDVSERLRHHHERSAVHDGVRREGVPGHVEVDRRRDAGTRRSFSNRIVLVRLPPRTTVGVSEDQVATALPRADRTEELLRLLGQVDVEDPFAAVSLARAQGRSVLASGLKSETTNCAKPP